MIRRYLLIGSLLGASGVALSAVSAHVAKAGSLQPTAHLMIMHAVLLVSLALHGTLTIPLRLAAGCIAFGTTLFAADLTVLAFGGNHLFEYAAPIGGSTMIAGWLLLALAALSLTPRKN